MISAVVTTIQAPTSSLVALVKRVRQHAIGVVIVGDRRTPSCEWPDGCRFLSLEGQKSAGFALGRMLPENHYSRKNLGYLSAVMSGATAIFDTDDDNAPLPNWEPRSLATRARPASARGWVNVYRCFTSLQIWPRGFPLEYVQRNTTAVLAAPISVEAPIQQGVVNGSPDVDAVWRLILDREFEFEGADSVYLAPGSWCPFNSQSTWWFPAAYTLMYLPSGAGFRMTDIWRSFVAQRCLWELGCGIVYHAPEMVQARNEHSLLKDFEQEVRGYLHNDALSQILEQTQLSSSPSAIGDNVYRCYEAIVGAQLLPRAEMALVGAWLDDLRAIRQSSPSAGGWP